MRTLQLNKREVLCVPDADGDIGQMATYDAVGWVQIGRMGSAESLLIEKTEWAAFLKFIYDIDRHMGVHSEGVYAQERVVE